jgi:hypothetical protein
VVSNIYLLISWNIYYVDITLLLGITNKFCGTIGYSRSPVILPNFYSIVFFPFDLDFLVGLLLAYLV